MEEAADNAGSSRLIVVEALMSHTRNSYIPLKSILWRASPRIRSIALPRFERGTCLSTGFVKRGTSGATFA